jgi:hypothetical protein
MMRYWESRFRRWTWFLILMAVGAAGLGSSRVPALGSSPLGDLRVYTDWNHMTSLAVQLDPTTGQAGVFDFFSQGQGLFRSQQAATVTNNSDGSIHIQYAGSAFLDVDARMDPVFGIVTPSGEDGQPVTVNLDAHIQDDHSATAQLWSGGGSPLHFVSTSPPQDVGPTVTAIVNSITQRDWATLYTYAYAPLQQAMTPATFASWIGSVLAGRGTVVTAQVTGAITKVTGATGFSLASVPVSLTLSNHGIQTTYPAILKLLLQNGQSWRFISIDPSS